MLADISEHQSVPDIPSPNFHISGLRMLFQYNLWLPADLSH